MVRVLHCHFLQVYSLKKFDKQSNWQDHNNSGKTEGIFEVTINKNYDNNDDDNGHQFN
jgi:hypothetical protein